MSDYHKPTMRLRWVEIGIDDNDVVRGMIPGWPENGPTYYKLQQWWETIAIPGPKGEWRDVKVDHS